MESQNQGTKDVVRHFGRDVEMGLRARPAFYRSTGFYQRYFEEDEAGLGKGFGIFADIHTSDRLFYERNGESRTGRQLFKKTVVETWKKLRISFIFGRHIKDIYIRLWRIK